MLTALLGVGIGIAHASIPGKVLSAPQCSTAVVAPSQSLCSTALADPSAVEVSAADSSAAPAPAETTDPIFACARPHSEPAHVSDQAPQSCALPDGPPASDDGQQPSASMPTPASDDQQQQSTTTAALGSNDVAYYHALEDMLLAIWQSDLFMQPRMTAYSRLAAEYGFQPGTTAWRPVRTIPPQLDRKVFPNPRAALAAFVTDHIEAQLDTEVWEVVTRLHMTDTAAIGAVLLWGYRDDALAGIDYRLTFSQHNDAWHLSKLEERYHCRRGVSTGDLCL